MRCVRRSASTAWAQGLQQPRAWLSTRWARSSVSSTPSLLTSSSTCSPCWSPRRAYASAPARGGADEGEEVDLMDMLLSQELGEGAPTAAAAATARTSTTESASGMASTESHTARARAASSDHQTVRDGQDELLRTVELHNLPRNWMHEEIIEFLHHVANHAGIVPPSISSSSSSSSAWEDAHDGSGEASEQDSGQEADSAIPHVRSPFVQHMRIPFGRRTGLVYGTPRLVLRSSALVHYLLNDLVFEEDDYRSRIYFTEVMPVREGADAEVGDAGEDAATGAHSERSRSRREGRTEYISIEETIEQEQATALASLELDRYLLAPDLLLDISKMHQRRLVTRGEKVVLRAFTDMAPAPTEDGMEAEDEDAQRHGSDSTMAAALFEAEEGVATSSGQARRHRHRRRRAARVADESAPAPRAGSMKDLGHGSMHNMPIPKPYVMGRNL